MDSDTNFANKDPAKKTRKRKLNRKQGEKKVGERSEDNKSDLGEDEISMDMDNNKAYGASNYPINKGNDLDGYNGGIDSKSDDINPYYFSGK